MLNIVLCIDKKYNDVAYLFLHTLLNNVSESIKIFIIHQNKSSFKEYVNLLEDYTYLNKLYVYEFKEDLSSINEIIHGHVTEATYYRIFLDRYLPDDLDYIFYVDADIICNQNPINRLKDEIIKLRKTEYLISAKTEFKKNKNTNYHFDRLNLKGQRYFNAGVLCIDYQGWLQSNYPSALRKNIFENQNKLEFWDQDLLNIAIDGKYQELDESLNFQVKLGKKDNDMSFEKLFSKEQIKNMTFIHYSGSYKPWTVRGALSKRSKIYNEAYEDLFKQKYNIVNTWKPAAFGHFFFEGLIKFKIKNLRHPFAFLKIFITSLIKKN